MSYTQVKTPNLDPVIYSGGQALSNWAGWCLAYVEVAFGTPRKYAKAWDGWLDTQHRHQDRTFPKKVYFPVWFEHWGTYNGVYGNWGHVAIALVNTSGAMVLWSSPASNKTYADTYTSIEAIERTYRAKYVGWSEDIARTQVIAPLQGGTQVTDIQNFQNCFITLAQRWPTQKEVDTWRESGLEAYTWVQKNAPNNLFNDHEALKRYQLAREKQGAKYPGGADKFAADRLQGGDTFQSVMDRDMKHYLERSKLADELLAKDVTPPLSSEQERHLRLGTALDNLLKEIS